MAATVAKIGTPRGLHAAGIFAETSIDGEEVGTLVLVVDRAKNLPNRKTMGKQNPYCAARLGKYAKKTPTDVRGGQTPRWDKELRFTVFDSIDYRNLKISIFNDDKRTDLIGETWVDLNDVILPGGGQADGWHSLNCKGRYAGELRLELTFYDSRPKPEKVVSAQAEKDKERERSQAPITTTLQPQGPKQAIPGPRELPAVKRRPLPADPLAPAPLTGQTPDRNRPVPTPEVTPRSYSSYPRHATVTDPGPEDIDPSELPQQNPPEPILPEADDREISSIAQAQQVTSQRAYEYDENINTNARPPQPELSHLGVQNSYYGRPEPTRTEMPRRLSHVESTIPEIQPVAGHSPEHLHSNASYARELRQKPSRNEIHAQNYLGSGPMRADVQTQQSMLHASSRPGPPENQPLRRVNAALQPTVEHYNGHQAIIVHNNPRLPPPPPAHTAYEDHESSYKYHDYQEQDAFPQYQESDIQENFHNDPQLYDQSYTPDDAHQDYEAEYIPESTPRNNRVRFIPDVISRPALQSQRPSLPESASYSLDHQMSHGRSEQGFREDQTETMEVADGVYDEQHFHHDQRLAHNESTGPGSMPTYAEHSYGPPTQLSAPIHRHSDPTLTRINQRSFHSAPTHQATVASRSFHVPSNPQLGSHSQQLQGFNRQLAQHRQSLPVRGAPSSAPSRPQPSEYPRSIISHRPRPSEPLTQVLHPWDDGYEEVEQGYPEQDDPSTIQRQSFGHISGNPGYQGAAPPSPERPRLRSQTLEEKQTKSFDIPIQNRGLHPDGRALIKPRPVSPRRDGERGRHMGNKMAIARKSVSPRPSGVNEQPSSTPYSPDSFSAYNPEPARPASLYSTSHDDREPVPMYQNFGSQVRSAPVSPGDMVNEDGYIIGSDGRTKDPSDHLPISSYAPEPERKGNRPTTVVTVKNRLGPRDAGYSPNPVHPIATSNNVLGHPPSANAPGPRKLQKPIPARPASEVHNQRFQIRPSNAAVGNQPPNSSMNSGSPLAPAQPSVINSNSYHARYPPAPPPIPHKYVQRGTGYGDPMDNYEDITYNQPPYPTDDSIRQDIASMDLGPVSAPSRLRRLRY